MFYLFFSNKIFGIFFISFMVCFAFLDNFIFHFYLMSFNRFYFFVSFSINSVILQTLPPPVPSKEKVIFHLEKEKSGSLHRR
jgi:hypothetical protein